MGVVYLKLLLLGKPFNHSNQLPTKRHHWTWLLSNNKKLLITGKTVVVQRKTSFSYFFYLQAAATVVTFELMIFQFSPVKSTTTTTISNITSNTCPCTK